MRTWRVSRHGEKDVEIQADHWEVGSHFVTFVVRYSAKGNMNKAKFIEAFPLKDITEIKLVKDDEAD
jgi:hypothetical protein